MDIIEHILEIASCLQLGPGEFVPCDASESARIIAQAKSRFVVGNPRVWWLALKSPPLVQEFPEGDGFEFLGEYMPAEETKLWFIPESDGAELTVFDADLPSVQRVLAEAPFFEYYLVGKKIDWLLIENDHNQLLYSAVR